LTKKHFPPVFRMQIFLKLPSAKVVVVEADYDENVSQIAEKVPFPNITQFIPESGIK